MASRPDPFVRAHQDAQKAVATFLPSMVGRNDHPDQTPPPHPLAKLDPLSDTLRVLSLARKGELMSARVARGLPPEDPKPTPEMAFGNQLDSVHTRAIQEAIASVPEEERGKFISEAHDSAVKWIGAHNGKVVVHGKVELAHSPESAERLAAKIVNNEVEGHDQRRIEQANPTQPSGTADNNNGTGRTATAVPTGSRGADSGTQANVQQAPQPAAQPVTQPDVQPEIVPPGDGDPPATGPAPSVRPQEAAKVGSRKRDGHQVTQPKNSIAANQKLALDAAPELYQALSGLTQQIPGTKFDRLRPQKATDRLDQKVEDNNDPDTLSDYLGAQIAADTPQAKDAIVEALKKNFNVIEVDDQFLTGRKDKAQYPSANVQVQMSNGMTAEVQIVPKEVQDATEQSHEFYKAGRDAEERGDHAERDRQWAKAGEINQGALAQFKARNGIADGKNQVAGYDVIGEPIQIGRHTFLRVKPGGQSGTPETVGTQDEQVGADVGDSGAPQDASTEDNIAALGPGHESGGAADGQQTTGLPAGSGGTAAPSFAKGNSVRLKDGSTGRIAYVHPTGSKLRVRTDDGRNLRDLDPSEVANVLA